MSEAHAGVALATDPCRTIDDSYSGAEPSKVKLTKWRKDSPQISRQPIVSIHPTHFFNPNLSPPQDTSRIIPPSLLRDRVLEPGSGRAAVTSRPGVVARNPRARHRPASCGRMPWLEAASHKLVAEGSRVDRAGCGEPAASCPWNVHGAGVVTGRLRDRHRAGRGSRATY